MEQVETVIVGGGQAGLAMSHHLRQSGREHVVLERARVAERWRTQRWDSLRFQFPNWTIEMPGRKYSGEFPDAFSHKDEVLRFIEDYAASIEPPIRTGVNVTALRPAARGGNFEVITDQGSIVARNVIIATGPYQRPRIPAFSADLPASIVQLHASEYRNPAQLPDGGVLVVGSGASGCQIAEELLESGRQVYLAVGRHVRVPRRYRGRDVFAWRRALGHLDRTADTLPKGKRMRAPLVTGIGGGHDIDLRNYAAKGMTLLGHVLDMRDGRVLLACDLEKHLRAGDQAFDDFTQAADEYLRIRGSDEEFVQDDTARHRERVPLESIGEIDLHSSNIGCVLWSTGYAFDFNWIELPVFNALGEPKHRRGVTEVPGIHFLGLPWLHKAQSSFLCGVGEDAQYLAQHIGERTD